MRKTRLCFSFVLLAVVLVSMTTGEVPKIQNQLHTSQKSWSEWFGLSKPVQAKTELVKKAIPEQPTKVKNNNTKKKKAASPSVEQSEPKLTAALKEAIVPGAATGSGAVFASSADAFVMMEEAKLMLSEGNFKDALDKLLVVFEHAPENQECNYLIGSILLGQQQFDLSEKFLVSAAILSNWSDSLSVVNLATNLRQLNKVDEALQSLRNGLKSVNNTDTRGELASAIGDAMLSIGNYSMAADWYLNAAIKRNTDIEAWIKASTVNFPTEGFNVVFAQNVLVEALTANPQNAELLFTLGLVGHKAGKVDIAIHFYKQALEASRENTLKNDLYFNAVSALATIHHEEGSYVEALQYYRAAEKLSPENVLLLSNYATLLASLRQWDDGHQLAKKALTIDPKSSVARKALSLFVLDM